MGDLSRRVHRDVNVAAFERAHVIADYVDGGETDPTLSTLATNCANAQDQGVEVAGGCGLGTPPHGQRQFNM